MPLYTLGQALALRRRKGRHPVSPAYSTLVAIWDRIESQLDLPGDVNRLTHGEQLVSELFLRLDGDVQNGGFRQYLENSAGDGAEHAKAYLAEAGAWPVLAILEDISGLFPDNLIPADRTERSNALEAAHEIAADLDALLDEADMRYARDQWALYRRLVDYVDTHQKDFAQPDPQTIRQLNRA